MEKAEEFGPEPDEEVEEEEEAEEEYVLEEAAPLVVEATEASTDKAVMDAIRTVWREEQSKEKKRTMFGFEHGEKWRQKKAKFFLFHGK